MSTDLAVIEAALKERRLPEGYTGHALVEPEGSLGAKFVVWCGTQVTAAPWPPAGLTNRATWLTAVPLLGPTEAAELVERVKVVEAAIERVRAVADGLGQASFLFPDGQRGVVLKILRALDGDGSDEVTRFTSANSAAQAVAPTPPFCERCGGRSAEGV